MHGIETTAVLQKAATALNDVVGLMPVTGPLLSGSTANLEPRFAGDAPRAC